MPRRWDSWMPCIELLARHGQQAFVALPADEVRRLSGSAAHLARRAFQVFGDGASRHVRARPAQDRAGQRVSAYTSIRPCGRCARVRSQRYYGAGRGARGQGRAGDECLEHPLSRKLNKGSWWWAAIWWPTAPHPRRLKNRPDQRRGDFRFAPVHQLLSEHLRRRDGVWPRRRGLRLQRRGGAAVRGPSGSPARWRRSCTGSIGPWPAGHRAQLVRAHRSQHGRAAVLRPSGRTSGYRLRIRLFGQRRGARPI